MRNSVKFVTLFLSIFLVSSAFAQDGSAWQGKFEQLDALLPTPNSYRSGSGAPGPAYWQQRADYEIDVEINDKTQELVGREKITYHNNSPEPLKFLWLQLDQNIFAPDNLTSQTQTGRIVDSLQAGLLSEVSGINTSDYKGGYKIESVRDAAGKNLKHTINHTMMRIDLPAPLKSGEQFVFSVDWRYTEYNRQLFDGRGGYEYFPDDGNFVYTFAQWFPRMCVFDDYEGWQNKQFYGRGEFALTFGDYKVRITVPSDHIVGATGWLQNPKDVLTKEQQERFARAQKTYDKPVFIVTESEAVKKEKSRSEKKSTWVFHAENVRDFAFASSRKFIWDAMAVKVGEHTPLAQSLYPKEGNPLWERESTLAVKNTLELYSKRTFDYPYPTAYSVHTANQGMEYPMICFNYGRPSKDGEYSQRTRAAMINVIIHEIGHNFFPMIVNSDERQWSWMDEGLNTFLDKETMRIYYSDLSGTRGTPLGIVPFMKGDKSQMRPIMAMSDNIRGAEFGPNAYFKPAAALTLLRETIMGPELFDAAFKEYAQRWAFKHPKPADFFRTMEDASAVDLDWFWRGWFFTNDHVDVEVSDVQWFRVRNEVADPEDKGVKVERGDLAGGDRPGTKRDDFSDGPNELTLTNTPQRLYGEFRSRVDDAAIQEKLEGKNIYQLTFTNKGGLVTPLVIEWTYKDGSKEIERIPAEVWRMNEQRITKVFVKDKEVTNILFDPNFELADVDVTNNTFPKKSESRFDQFKRQN